jgi:hypothetical protein
VCVQCARDGPGGAQRKCVRLRGERLPSTRQRPVGALVGGGFSAQSVAGQGSARTRIALAATRVQSTQPTAIVGPVSTFSTSAAAILAFAAGPRFAKDQTVCISTNPPATAIVGRVDGTLSPRYTPHPCVFAAHHILHARPPDASGCASASRI